MPACAFVPAHGSTPMRTASSLPTTRSTAETSTRVLPRGRWPERMHPEDRAAFAAVVEEVLRLEGLELIPSVLPAAPPGRGLTADQKRRRAIGKSLALAGFVEILPTPFLPAGVFDRCVG